MVYLRYLGKNSVKEFRKTARQQASPLYSFGISYFVHLEADKNWENSLIFMLQSKDPKPRGVNWKMSKNACENL